MFTQTFCRFFLSSFFLVGLVVAQLAYQRVSLDVHNEHRAKHHVVALKSSVDLNSRAVRCAEHYALKGTIDHSCPHKNGAGENLWAQWRGNPTNETAARSSANGWYSQVSKYDYTLDYQPGTGHFSQMVWKSSENYGFGVARAGETIYACSLYSPRGNVIGMFRSNVLRP